MSNPWKNIGGPPVDTMANIMSEQYAHSVQDMELKLLEKRLAEAQEEFVDEATCDLKVASSKEDEEWEDYSSLLEEADVASTSTSHNASSTLPLPADVFKIAEKDVSSLGCDSDEVIAYMLQAQYDQEYNKEVQRVEKHFNKNSKVTVTLDKFLRKGNIDDIDDNEYFEEEDETASLKRDWDRFETNEKELDGIPKCGFKAIKEGGMITKHDDHLCGVRNAGRIMSFPLEFPTGDAASFDMKLSNKVYNQLKNYSRRSFYHSNAKKNKKHDRTEYVATAEMGLDGPTCLLIYKLINNQILEEVTGIISTGKEAVILHAESDPTALIESEAHGGRQGVMSTPRILPKECAVKIFKTTLNEFKQRDRYIKDDYRFKDRFSKQNDRSVINMWAEKEMLNLKRMQSVGINCPDVVILKKHVLVMSFIGDNLKAAPKLKDARLSDAEWCCVYDEIITAMYKLYNEAKLVHADLSEYNILWHDNKCWFIDVAQSVPPDHAGAMEFLMRDCNNIINFFKKRVPNIYTKEQLFEYITTLNAEVHNAAMLERIHTRGASMQEATAPNQESCPDDLKALVFPFELAWEKSQDDRQQQKMETTKLDIDYITANAMPVLSMSCGSESIEKASSLPTVVIDNVKNTANN